MAVTMTGITELRGHFTYLDDLALLQGGGEMASLARFVVTSYPQHDTHRGNRRQNSVL